MQVERKYEQWKAITESDFVTLFIKTWFTFIAVLRELNPDVDVFTADGMPRGDKPFLNAYKEGIMPFVQKNIDTDDFAQELFSMYPISMRKVMDVFPQYFFQTFFQVNREFSYEEKTIDLDKDGNLKERYQVNLHIVDKHILKFRFLPFVVATIVATAAIQAALPGSRRFLAAVFISFAFSTRRFSPPNRIGAQISKILS